MMPGDTAAYAHGQRATTATTYSAPARQRATLSHTLAQLCDRTFSPLLAAVIAATEQQES